MATRLELRLAQEEALELVKGLVSEFREALDDDTEIDGADFLDKFLELYWEREALTAYLDSQRTS